MFRNDVAGVPASRLEMLRKLPMFDRYSDEELVRVDALVYETTMPVGALLTVLTIMTVMGITNHMGWEMFPTWLVKGRAGKWLITASHHQLHHQRNKCNYGLYFRFWDRLCGTDGGLGTFEPRRRARDRATVGADLRRDGGDRRAA